MTDGRRRIDTPSGNVGFARRDLIGLLAAGAAILAPRGGVAAAARRISFIDLIHAPILRRFYSAEPQGRFTKDGLAGFNATGMRLVEEQRTGADWITRWRVCGREDWREFGWLILDRGSAVQRPDGGFERYGYYHSNSLFLEGLARACILDAKGRTAARLSVLERGCAWLEQPANRTRGLEENAPYTHRDYILAGLFGQAARLLRDETLHRIGDRFLTEALAKQRADGVNPELGGGDVSYQMAGVFAACRLYEYFPARQAALRRMMRAAINWNLQFVRPDGSIDTAGSTRAGREKSYDIVKQPDRPVMFQTLGYTTVLMPNPRWTAAALSIARAARFAV